MPEKHACARLWLRMDPESGSGGADRGTRQNLSELDSLGPWMFAHTSHSSIEGKLRGTSPRPCVKRARTEWYRSFHAFVSEQKTQSAGVSCHIRCVSLPAQQPGTPAPSTVIEDYLNYAQHRNFTRRAGACVWVGHSRRSVLRECEPRLTKRKHQHDE